MLCISCVFGTSIYLYVFSCWFSRGQFSSRVGRYFPLGLLCGRASERFGASVNEEEEEEEEEEEGGDLAT